MSDDTTTAEAAELAAGSGVEGRFDSIATRTGGRYDRWLLIVGGVLVPIGILLVVLGWIGASRTPFVFEQIPYLISGGLLGISLVFGGGFVYFAYWQTRTVRDARQHQQELLAALRDIAAQLSARDLEGGARSLVAGDAFVSTEKGSMYHRADCPVTQGRDKLRPVRGDEPGLRPCGICNPVLSVG
jgi:hypothetical protein